MHEMIRFERELELLRGEHEPAREEEEVGKVSASDEANAARHKTWLREVAKLPVELKQAIEKGTPKNYWEIYVRALAYGIRDQNRIARLMYNAAYGREHGYHPAKSKAGVEAWNKTKSDLWEFKRKPVPAAARTGGNPCAKGKPKPFAGDNPEVDITGRYYTENPRWVYVINQAGNHVEGFASHAADRPPVIEFHGDLEGGKRFQLFRRDEPGPFKVIEWAATGTTIDGEPLRLLERRPTLGGALWKDDLGKRNLDVIAKAELAPLTPGQLRFIEKTLSKSVLASIFALYFDKNQKQKGFELLKDAIFSERKSEAPRLNLFNGYNQPIVRLYAKKLLTLNRWTSAENVTRSHADWMQIMLDMNLKSGAPWLAEFEKYVGLRARPFSGAGKHVYEVEVSLTGGSLLLAGYGGKITIHKRSDRTWSQTYDIQLLGLTVALSWLDIKVNDDFKGVARSHIEWTKNDFYGPVWLDRVSGGVALNVASAQAGRLHVIGDGSLPPLDVFFHEAKFDYPDLNKLAEEGIKRAVEGPRNYGLDPKLPFGKSPADTPPLTKTDVAKSALDVSASVLEGSITANLFDTLTRRRKENIVLSQQWDPNLPLVRPYASDVHFCLDDDALTPLALQALRVLCAQELTAFLSPKSALLVVGHADTLGPKDPKAREKHNQDLSRRRALNTVAAIRKILGKKFKIEGKDENMVVAMGHKVAAAASPNARTAAPEHRRVQVLLNGTLVLTLFGQPPA